MRFNPYLINTGAGTLRGPGNSLFQKSLKDNSAAPRIDDMNLNDVLKKNSVPNAGLNPLRPDSGCPLRAGTWHGRPGRAPGRCGCAVTSLLQRGGGGAVC